MEADMLGDGDDAGHCSNRWSAEDYRAASSEDRAIYRLWLRGVIVFYAGVLLISGAVAISSYKDVGLTRLANLYAHSTAGSAGSGKDNSVASRPPHATAKSAWW
jgi:hypothetical protein